MVINRSNKVWNNFYFSLWTDDDVGDANDDMVACDTNLNFGYTYNGDNSDIIYGTAPPAVGFLILKGPAVYTGNNNDTSWICNANNKIIRTGYKDRKMDVYFNYLKNHYIYGNPRNYRESYRIIKGLTRDGSAIINPITNKPTTFMYSGDPVTGTGWITGPILPGDQHFLISTGPVNMNPGDTQYIVIAQIIARGTSNLNSVAVLRQYVQDIKKYYNNCFAGVPIGIEPISNIIPERFELYQNYPNPFNPYTVISFQCTMYNKVMIKIYDVMGREVEMLVNEQLQPGKYKVAWDGSKYASGVYYYSLSAGDNLIGTRKMVLMK